MSFVPGKVGKETIRQAYEAVGIPEPEFLDDWYCLPALDWVAGEFATYFLGWLSSDRRSYRKGKDDCDDFGRSASEEARACMRDTPDVPDDCAIAFGDVIYKPDYSSQSHYVNTFPYRDIDGNFHIAFFEPQTCKVFQMSRSELDSCCPPRF